MSVFSGLGDARQISSARTPASSMHHPAHPPRTSPCNWPAARPPSPQGGLPAARPPPQCNQPLIRPRVPSRSYKLYIFSDFQVSPHIRHVIRFRTVENAKTCCFLLAVVAIGSNPTRRKSTRRQWMSCLIASDGNYCKKKETRNPLPLSFNDG